MKLKKSRSMAYRSRSRGISPAMAAKLARYKATLSTMRKKAKTNKKTLTVALLAGVAAGAYFMFKKPK